MPKTDHIEYEKRLMNIQGWIIDGVPSAMIVQQILMKDWCKSDRHARRMMEGARKKWVQFESEDILERRKLKIQQLLHLKRSLKDIYKGTPEGIRAAMMVEKEIIKLDGLQSPVKIKVESTQSYVPITTSALEAIAKKISANAAPKQVE